MNCYRISFIFPLLLFYFLISINGGDDEDPFTTTDPKKREPSPCEICKFFANELTSRLDESAHSKEVLETGHSLEKRKKFRYLTSELRLTEALHEPHICEKILDYNVHAERKGSLRYAKGMSETMQTLHGLVNKGVKVELGIPYELWDRPSAEVSKMHRACFTFAEEFEEVIESWYFDHQRDGRLVDYLCAQRFLKGKDQKCLQEAYAPTRDKGDTDNDDRIDVEKDSKKSKDRKKSKTKNNSKDLVNNKNNKHLNNNKGDTLDITNDDDDNSVYATPSPEIFPQGIPRPTQVPSTTPMPKTSRNEGDL